MSRRGLAIVVPTAARPFLVRNQRDQEVSRDEPASHVEHHEQNSRIDYESEQ
jgi:hypothetical protein